MPGTRHEEYQSFVNGLPFVFYADLERNCFHRSKENNWHDNLEIQICTKGSGLVLLDGKPFPFHENDIIVVNSNVIHYTGTDTELTYSCLIISTDFCRTIGIDPQQFTFSPFVKSAVLTDAFAALKDICSDFSVAFRTAKLNQLVLHILIELAENHVTAHKPCSSNVKHFETVKSAVCYIRKNYDKKITLDEISKAVLYDKYALCKAFKRLTGQTVMENLNNYRCIKAIDCLNEGHTVAGTAALCGFDNLSFFTKTFKKYIGRLPSAYKK